METSYCPDCGNINKSWGHERFVGGGGWSLYRCRYCWCEYANGTKQGKWEIKTTWFSLMRRVFVPCDIKPVGEET